MPPLFQNALAILAGLILGCIVNMAIVIIGPMVIPVPDGVDMSDMERFAENLKLLKPINFVAPFVAHALGTFVAAWCAAKLANCHPMIIGVIVGIFFLAGGITMVVSYGGPLWFVLLDLVVAYLPMSFLGVTCVAKRNVEIETQE